MNHKLAFHIHNDLELLTEYPLALSYMNECYIMQEDRVVFIGSCTGGNDFIKLNNNKYKKDVWKGTEPKSKLKALKNRKVYMTAKDKKRAEKEAKHAHLEAFMGDKGDTIL